MNQLKQEAMWGIIPKRHRAKKLIKQISKNILAQRGAGAKPVDEK